MTLEEMRSEILTRAWELADNDPNITHADCVRLADIPRTKKEAQEILDSDIQSEMAWLTECGGKRLYFWNR